jgi:hypothetical protein
MAPSGHAERLCLAVLQAENLRAQLKVDVRQQGDGHLREIALEEIGDSDFYVA